jgi:hypothetical protein
MLPCRQWTEVTLLLFTIVAAGATYSDVGDTWIQWLLASTMVGVVLLVDIMFTHEKAFIYDPDYKNWSRKNK